MGKRQTSQTNPEQAVELSHRMMKTQTWHSLDSNARAIYIELAMLYHDDDRHMMENRNDIVHRD